jgi:hypothetical protein
MNGTDAKSRQVVNVIKMIGHWYPRRSTHPICFSHLRKMAGLAGFQTKSLNTKTVVERLAEYYERRHSLGKYKTDAATWKYFRKDSRPARPSDAMGNYRYAHNTDIRPSIRSDLAALREWLVVRSGEWERDGSVIIRGLFDWLLKDGKLLGLVHEEFDLYDYHLREAGGRPNYGWLRIIYHSTIQQIVRQSPHYYAAYVLLREDHNPRLISYPYYTKYAKAGDNTSFRHIDLNIPELVNNKRGYSLIQGSVSFDDESPAECTELLLGMHHHLGDWWEDVKKRESIARDKKVADGQVIRITDRMWTSADRAKYGLDFKPQVARCGDVRISLPHLPHGSRGPATRVRRTILPWYMSIEADHESLDTVEAGTWTELAAAHRNLTPGPSSPSGLHNMFGNVPYVFPAALQVTGLGPISDALVGRTRWDDPRVATEASILLGADAIGRQLLLEDWEGKAAKMLKENMAFTRRHERKVYGEKSFYWRREQGLLDERVPDDDPDPDMEDEDSALDLDAPPELVMEFAEEGDMARGAW